jgi:hypothetical protein
MNLLKPDMDMFAGLLLGLVVIPFLLAKVRK